MVSETLQEERSGEKSLHRDDEEQTLVVFEMEGEEFGIDVNHVLTINKYQTPTRIPQTPPYIEGVINLRGEVIVIINLRRKFGYPERPVDDETRIIVVEVEDRRLGLVVDSVKEVLRIPVSAIEKAPPTIAERIESEFIIGVAVLENRLIVLLDMDTLFQKHEMEELASAKSVGVRIHEMLEKERQEKGIGSNKPEEKLGKKDKESNEAAKEEKIEKQEEHKKESAATKEEKSEKDNTENEQTREQTVNEAHNEADSGKPEEKDVTPENQKVHVHQKKEVGG